MPAKPQPRYHKTKGYWYIVRDGKQKFLARDFATAWEKWRGTVRLGPDAKRLNAPGSVAEAVETWLQLHPGPDEKFRLLRWVRWAGRMPVDDLDVGHLEAFASHLRTTAGRSGSNHKRRREPYAPKTICDTINSTRRVLQWCIDYGWLNRMPRVPRLSKGMRHPRDIEQVDIDRVWRGLPRFAKPILTFILETGCRPSEACRLRWDHIDLEKGLCTMTEHKTAHGGRVRTIALTPVAREIVEKIPRRFGYVFLSCLAEPYTSSGLRSILRRRGIKSVYALRHTRAQRMLDEGYPLHDVAAWLGHSDLSTVGVYAQIRAERLREIAASLKPMVSPEPQLKVAT